MRIPRRTALYAEDFQVENKVDQMIAAKGHGEPV